MDVNECKEMVLATIRASFQDVIYEREPALFNSGWSRATLHILNRVETAFAEAEAKERPRLTVCAECGFEVGHAMKCPTQANSSMRCATPRPASSDALAKFEWPEIYLPYEPKYLDEADKSEVLVCIERLEAVMQKHLKYHRGGDRWDR